ncbi:hypothetical protein EV401DRAFT_2040003, partial [Pisolithus croceorrhizus]
TGVFAIPQRSIPFAQVLPPALGTWTFLFPPLLKVLCEPVQALLLLHLPTFNLQVRIVPRAMWMFPYTHKLKKYPPVPSLRPPYRL